MNARTGLEAEVPSRELCGKMAAIPALKEAFSMGAFYWAVMLIRDGIPQYSPVPSMGLRHSSTPAPTVREMLVWLDGVEQGEFNIWSGGKSYDITDPDALARACIEVAKW